MTEPSSIVASVAEDLEKVVENAYSWLAELDSDAVHHRPSPDRWTIAEVVGHLVDSAANNHHRFVRAQEVEGALTFPDYQQRSWVEKQSYDDSSWTELIELWRLYNRHLARVIRNIDARSLPVICTITPHPPATLEFIVRDYVVHMNHHLGKIRGRID